MAFSDHDNETFVIEFERDALLPKHGESRVIELPDRRVEAYAVRASGDARPTCGDVFSGDPGFAVKWFAAKGTLTLMSSPVPGDWITAGHEYFVSAAIEGLEVARRGGSRVLGPKELLLAGRAGLGPGG